MNKLAEQIEVLEVKTAVLEDRYASIEKALLDIKKILETHLHNFSWPNLLLTISNLIVLLSVFVGLLTLIHK